MPKCSGLPSGPCPHSRNDRTVTWSGCDLYLCSDCYQYRWPVAGNKSSNIKNPHHGRENKVASAETSSCLQVKNCSKGWASGKSSICKNSVLNGRVIDESFNSESSDLDVPVFDESLFYESSLSKSSVLDGRMTGESSNSKKSDQCERVIAESSNSINSDLGGRIMDECSSSENSVQRVWVMDESSNSMYSDRARGLSGEGSNLEHKVSFNQSQIIQNAVDNAMSLSQTLNKKRGTCSVCFKVRHLLKDKGTIHPHGPTLNRCPGSYKPPLLEPTPSAVANDNIESTEPDLRAPKLPHSNHFPSPDLNIHPESIQHPALPSNTIKHIPKAARPECARSLAIILNKITTSPSNLDDWLHLLNFGKVVLITPPRAGKRISLPNIIKKRTICYSNSTDVPHSFKDTRTRSIRKNFDSLSSVIRSKIEDGNMRAAVRLLCSDDSLASDNSETLRSLQEKHPSRIDILPAPADHVFTQALQVTQDEILKAVRSFPAGSAGGPDGIRPQHVLELISDPVAGPILLPALTGFTNMLLNGDCPDAVRKILFGGRLIAIGKKDGGVRPIAIGYTWRRLAAKCANAYATSKITSYLSPIQVGVGVKGGCEATVHAVRRYLESLPEDYGVIKLDFKNAFNSLNRSRMLTEVLHFIPEIYQFCHSSYSGSSILKYNDHSIESVVGVQQGDPLGPLLFGLAIHPLLKSLSSPLEVAYLDDVTLGGNAISLDRDVDIIMIKGKELGLELNLHKCELISSTPLLLSHPVIGTFNRIKIEESTLLGAPLTSGLAMDRTLTARIEDLQRASKRLILISRHDALTLLRFSLSAPKLIYTMRSSPCFDHLSLNKFDDQLRECLSTITNIQLSDAQWRQASLPIKKGGLGIRLISEVASSAFLSSISATKILQDSILIYTDAVSDASHYRALSYWTHRYNSITPLGEAAYMQRNWDAPAIEDSYKQILDCQSDATDRARILAVSAPRSSDWLHAYPISSCGLHLDDEAIRVAVGFRLGARICEPHLCPCGSVVDSRGIHCLSCRRSAGRASRHHNLNDIIWRALTRANVPSVKEPPGLFRSDGKRPDGLTMIPWHDGKCLAWDVTVTDTLANSYLNATSISAGAAAELAALRKTEKYRDLPSAYYFLPVAIETFGPVNEAASEFLSELGRRMSMLTQEKREASFLRQRISMALQRYNAVCFRGSFSAFDDAVYEEAYPYLHIHDSPTSSAVDFSPSVDMPLSTSVHTAHQQDFDNWKERRPGTYNSSHKSMSKFSISNVHADQSKFRGSADHVTATSESILEIGGIFEYPVYNDFNNENTVRCSLAVSTELTGSSAATTESSVSSKSSSTELSKSQLSANESVELPAVSGTRPIKSSAVALQSFYISVAAIVPADEAVVECDDLSVSSFPAKKSYRKVLDGLRSYPDRYHLVYSLSFGIIIENIETRCQAARSEFSNNITCLDISKCGKFIASGQLTYIGYKADAIVWEYELKTLYGTFTIHREAVGDVPFTNYAKYLITLGGIDDITVVAWSISGTVPIRCCNAQTAGPARCLDTFNQIDQHFVTAGNDKIRFWYFLPDRRKSLPTDFRASKPLRSITCFVVETSDKFFYRGTTTGDVMAFNACGRNFLGVGQPNTCFGCGIHAMDMFCRFQLIVGVANGTVVFLNSDLKRIKDKNVKMERVTSITIRGPGDQFFVGSKLDDKYTILDLQCKIPQDQLLSFSHCAAINDIAFPYCCSELFVTCFTQGISVWYVRSKQEQLRITVPNMTCNSPHVIKDGNSFISGWSDKLIHSVTTAYSAAVTAIFGFSLCRKFINGNDFGHLVTWDIPEPRLTKIIIYDTKHQLLMVQLGKISAIRMAKGDKQCVVACHDCSCIIWSLCCKRQIAVLRADSRFAPLCYHPDETQLVTCASDRKITFLGAVDGSHYREIVGSQCRSIIVIDISSDGRYFVTGVEGRHVKVWLYEEGLISHYGSGHTATITSLAISPDGTFIVSRLPYSPTFITTLACSMASHSNDSAGSRRCCRTNCRYVNCTVSNGHGQGYDSAPGALDQVVVQTSTAAGQHCNSNTSSYNQLCEDSDIIKDVELNDAEAHDDRGVEFFVQWIEETSVNSNSSGSSDSVVNDDVNDDMAKAENHIIAEPVRTGRNNSISNRDGSPKHRTRRIRKATVDPETGMKLEPRRSTRLQARATANAPALVFPARGARVRRVENVMGASHASFSVEDYLSCEDLLQPSGSYDYVQTDDSDDGENK